MRACAAILLVGLWASSAAAAPRTLVVPRPAVIGVDAGSADAFADLLRQELSKRPEFQVLMTARTPPDPCGDEICGPQIAHTAGTQLALVINLSKIGQKVIVRFTLVDVGGPRLYSDSTTAASLDDLVPLAPRIAQSAATGQSLGDNATVSTVTQEEAKEPVRKKALFTTGGRLGIFLPVGDAYGGSGALTNIGAFTMYELREMAVLVECDLRFPGSDKSNTKMFGFDLDLGGRYFPDPESSSGWFIGGGMGWRYAHVSIDGTGSSSASDQGLGGYAGVGVVFLRTSDLHIILDARYDVNLFRLDGLSKGTYAHGVMATVGFSYTKGARGLFY